MPNPISVLFLFYKESPGLFRRVKLQFPSIHWSGCGGDRILVKILVRTLWRRCPFLFKMTKPLMKKVLVSVLAFPVFSFFLPETRGYHHDTENLTSDMVGEEGKTWVLLASQNVPTCCFLVSRFGFPQKKRSSDKNSTVVYSGSNPRQHQ